MFLSLCFVLPAIEICAWILTLFLAPAALQKNWPYLTAIGVAAGCFLVAVILYTAPRSQIAYEGDEANPLGVNIILLTVNAVLGTGVGVVIWSISLLLRRLSRKATSPRGALSDG